MEHVSFTHMEHGTAEDYALIDSQFKKHVSSHLPDYLMEILRSMAGPTFGYQIDRYRHSLQSATRALKNNEKYPNGFLSMFQLAIMQIKDSNAVSITIGMLNPSTPT